MGTPRFLIPRAGNFFVPVPSVANCATLKPWTKSKILRNKYKLIPKLLTYVVDFFYIRSVAHSNLNLWTLFANVKEAKGYDFEPLFNHCICECKSFIH